MKGLNNFQQLTDNDINKVNGGGGWLQYVIGIAASGMEHSNDIVAGWRAANRRHRR